MNGLEDGALITNVGRRGESETTDEAGAHIGKNVSVQVWHNEDLVVVWGWVGDDLQAGVVDQFGVELSGWEVLGDALGGGKEKPIGHLHDGGFVDGANLGAANVLGVLKGVAADALGSLTGDELDGLDNAINDDVLNTRVLSLSVLSDQDGVNTIVWGFVASDGAARADVGEEVEGAAESKVEGNVALSNWSLNVMFSWCSSSLRWGDRTASGPLRATLLRSMEVIVSFGMTVVPSEVSLGVTSTGSHLIGV